MRIPAEKARLLDSIVEALARVPDLDAIALGGSHARGNHGPDSDLDVGLYYREARPFRIEDIRRIAQKFSATGSPTVADFYGWGPFVNGGAWIDNKSCKIDFLYRNLDQLERTAAGAERGEWEHNFDQQPPFGFRTVTTLGEIHICKPLHDPVNVLGPLKVAVAQFPPALRMRVLQDTLWGAEFSFQFARNFGKAGDVPNTTGCMTRIYHYLVQALYALNETYFINDKRSSAEIETFLKKPPDFGARFSAILAAPGDSAEKLGASLAGARQLFEEMVALAGGDYTPRFPTA